MANHNSCTSFSKIRETWSVTLLYYVGTRPYKVLILAYEREMAKSWLLQKYLVLSRNPFRGGETFFFSIRFQQKEINFVRRQQMSNKRLSEPITLLCRIITQECTNINHARYEIIKVGTVEESGKK